MDFLNNPTREMLAAGRVAVMAARISSVDWTVRDHYKASGHSTEGLPEDVLDERGPITKESEAALVWAAMVNAMP